MQQTWQQVMIAVLNQKTFTKYLPGTSSVLGARDTKMKSMFPILKELTEEEKISNYNMM